MNWFLLICFLCHFPKAKLEAYFPPMNLHFEIWPVQSQFPDGLDPSIEGTEDAIQIRRHKA